jgi:SAM-dependent methyltransferase
MQKEFEAYSQRSLWDTMWTERVIERELESCDLELPAKDLFLSYIPKLSKVIEAGCGLGKWVIYLKRLGYDILGIDNNELAVTKLREYDHSVQVELGDILDIKYPDNTFGAYISMGVVEHFEDGPIPALREAYRVLKPGGLIFVSVPTVNILRKIIRHPMRKAINAPFTSYAMLRTTWNKSKRTALLSAIGSLVPVRIKSIVLRGKTINYHFVEYRYLKSELEGFLKQTGFEVIKMVPNDFYGSKDHAVGLVVDFPFLEARNGSNFRLNPAGKLISWLINGISPWIGCSSIICVGTSLKPK